MDRADAEYYPERTQGGLEGLLREQLGKTPWWMISFGAHALIVMALYFVMFDVQTPVPPAPVQMDVAQLEEDPFPDEELDAPDPEIDSDLKPSNTDFQNPEISDDDVDPQTDENAEDEPTGDPDNLSPEPSNNKYQYTAIGVGGGAAGKWGKNGLGGRYSMGRGGPPGGRHKRKLVDAGISWLACHQSADGSWSCNDFQHNCTKNICDGAGASAEYTPGTTSLAVLAFLGAGHTQRHGPYRETVKRALRYLTSIQTPDGCVGAKSGQGHYLYNHAIGTMALAEAYGMTLAPSLKRPAQLAVDFLVSAQNPYMGWRYGIRPGDNDTSVTGWAVLALKSAKLSELDVPDEAFAGAKNWIDKVTDESFYKTGYLAKGDNGARLPEAQQYAPTEAMTAAGLACRVFMGAPRDDPAVRGATTLLKNQVPAWDPQHGNDYYYWYYGTLAMFQVGGDAWKAWERGLEQSIVKYQRRGGDEEGSWDPTSAWGGAGGRVYATAVNVLSLEVYYRYSKVLKDK